MTDRDEGAAERVVRVIAALFGVGSLVFVGLLAPGMIPQLGDVPAWWTVLALTGVLVVPVVMSVTAFQLRIRTLLRLTSVPAVIYLLALISLPLVQGPRIGVHDSAPWLLGLTATGTTAAALAWRPRWVWPYVVVVGVLVALDRVWTAEVPLTLVAVQDATYATFFCAVFCSLALGARAAGRSVDGATRASLDAAGEAAAARSRERERERVDALVHDEVLATLLIASRTEGAVDDAIRSGARRALSRLHALTKEDSPGVPVDVGAFVERLRATVTEFAPDATFSGDLTAREPLPSQVVESFATATAEALRNARMHGGPSARVNVALHGVHGSVAVLVGDDGVGFDPASVPPTRLGVAGSVVGRMRAVGGEATVVSSPGSGTKVWLEWPSR